MNGLNKLRKKYRKVFEDDSKDINEKSMENSKTVNDIIEKKYNFRMKDNLNTVSNNNNFSKLTPFNKYIIISNKYLNKNRNNINDNTTFFNNESNKKNSINYINDIDINGSNSERKLKNFNDDNSNENISLYKLNKNKRNKNLNNDSLKQNISNEKKLTILIPKENSIELTLNKEENIPNCIICGRMFPLINIFSTKLCKHYFCQNCLKKYYMNENLNDSNIYKCPILKCNQYYENEIIKNIIFKSNSYNDKIEIFKSINENKNKKDINKYKKNNLIDINTNKSFFLYSKFKKDICPFCKENKIYSNDKYCVCLNCQKKYCKYCQNLYNENHFNKLNTLRCKIYYKINDEEYKTIINRRKKDFWIKILFSFILVFAGYFCLVIGYIKQIKISIKNVFFCNYVNKNIFLFYLIYFFYLISLLCILFIIIPLFIIIIPYFPIISILN